jgi:hypothetical protein
MCQRLITARPRGLASKTPPSPGPRRALWQATSLETSAVCAGCGGLLERPASGTALVCLLPPEALRGKLRNSATTLVALRAAGPNPSLKRSANGRPPGPGRRYTVHFRQPGPAALPLAPA